MCAGGKGGGVRLGEGVLRKLCDINGNKHRQGGEEGWYEFREEHVVLKTGMQIWAMKWRKMKLQIVLNLDMEPS